MVSIFYQCILDAPSEPPRKRHDLTWSGTHLRFVDHRFSRIAKLSGSPGSQRREIDQSPLIPVWMICDLTRVAGYYRDIGQERAHHVRLCSRVRFLPSAR